MLPARWKGVRDFFALLMAPLLEAEVPGCFLVEQNGPDGSNWSHLAPTAINLRGEDPALDAARAVAAACGASAEQLDPGPVPQGGMAVFYVPSAVRGRGRCGTNVLAASAIVLDIDDKSVGGRAGCMAALSRIPEPSFVVHSGGGIQVGYTLNEAVEFRREDPAELEHQVRAWLAPAKALGKITGADDTHWPGHLFRAPGAYHLKNPTRPVLVTVDLHPERRFNLDDFDDLTACLDEREFQSSVDGLIAQLTGAKRRTRGSSVTAPEAVDGVVEIPPVVSKAMTRLLNLGIHPKYTNKCGTLDRSRATFAAAISLLASGLDESETAGVLMASALKPAVGDRGEYGTDWLRGQVTKAAAYLEREGAVR